MLRDNERCPDQTDRKPEQEKRLIAMCKANPHYWKCPEHKQGGVRPPRTEPVAQPAGEKARQNGGGH